MNNAQRIKVLQGGLRISGSPPIHVPGSPLLSIITVVYNGEKHLEETIQSVIIQDYPNLEYIVIDGGSTDKTVDIIRKYEDRIDYWVSEPDTGIYDAMNKGISIANGDIIGIVNSDDYYLPGAIQKIADAANKNIDADLFHGNLLFKRANGDSETWFSKGAIREADAYRMPVNHPTVFVRSACYKRYGAFNTAYSTIADFDLIIKFLFKCRVRFHYLNEPIAVMREGGKGCVYSWSTYVDLVTILSRSNLGFLTRIKARISYLRLMVLQHFKRKMGPGNFIKMWQK